MRWLVGSSLRFRFLVVAAGVALMVFGASKLRDMPVDVFPEFAPPFVEVQTEGPGMSTTEAESLLTVPLEQALSSTPGLDVMRSKTVPGLSAITLIFKPGTDSLVARQLVNERLAIAIPSIPSSAGMPWILQPLSATSRTMKIGITSTRYSPTDLSMIAYWTIRWRLMKVPGVANVVIWGDRWKQIQVQADPRRMLAHEVTLDHLMTDTSEALDFGLLKYSDAAKSRVGGFIETPNQRFLVHHILPIVGPSGLAQVTISGRRNADGSPLRIGDVADVVWGHQPLIGDAVINDRPGLMMVVEKFPWGNTLQVTRGVEQALRAMQPGLKGVTFDTHIFRPANFIEQSIHNLTSALLIGCLLVIGVLFLFLFEWRAALISLVAIPLSLMAAAVVLSVRGQTINTMILAGLVISVGVVVDDAIIDVENIVRRLRKARQEGSTRSTAAIILDASLEVRTAIVYATLIIVLAVVPVLFLQGVTGAFFTPLVTSYGLAVFASMLVAITVTPALSLILLARAPLERRGSPVMRALQRAYTAVLARVIRRPGPALALTAVVLGAGLLAYPALGESLFPAFKQRDFLMHFMTKPGTSHEEEMRMVERVSRETRAIPGIQHFGSHVGRAVQGEEINGINFAENWISISPHADYQKTLNALDALSASHAGMFSNVETYLNERIEEVLAGTSDAVVIRIFGPNLRTLHDTAASVQRALTPIRGIEDLHTEVQTMIPHVQVLPKPLQDARYGLKPGDIRRASNALLSGDEVSDIHRDSKVNDIIVWSTPETRNSVDAIRRLPIDTPSGRRVRLEDAAYVRILPTPNQISRENGSRRIDVMLNPGSRDLGSVVSEVKSRLAGVRFPLGYHARLLGEFQERQGAQNRILIFGIAAAIGILLMLQVCFRSWRAALLSFVTLPFALVGGVLAAYATGGVISMGSLVGFLTVFGIAARNGILMINHFQHLEEHEGEPFGPELVLRGARERLAPIVMTALATGLALVPLVAAGEIPGAEIEYPMAIVILGGLVTSTVLNLFVVPSLYLRFARPRAGLPAGPATPA